MVKHNPLVWAVLIMLTLFACGRKTLPVAPNVYVPPAVENLTATSASGEVTLRWIVPDGQRQRKKGLSRVVVFMADRFSCPDCPPAFEPIASISSRELAENDRGDLIGTYTLPAREKGRRLFYVKPFTSLGMQGPESDIVEVVRPAEER